MILKQGCICHLHVAVNTEKFRKAMSSNSTLKKCVDGTKTHETAGEVRFTLKVPVFKGNIS